MAKLAKGFAPPSRPGFTKSKMLHRSPSRFSIGVPVRARREPAFTVFAALVCRVPGFLIACASSRIASRQVVAWTQAKRCNEP